MQTKTAKRNEIVDWTEDMMVEVVLTADYEVVWEQLTRIGVAMHNTKRLIQSCHLLSMNDKFYIVHFKELFALDNRDLTFTREDFCRRNYIIKKLVEWNMVKVVDPNLIKQSLITTNVNIIKCSDKDSWTLQSKYYLEPIC